MKTKLKTLLVAVMMLLVQFSFAGPTEDLWAALKAANYPNALAAIAAGADVKTPDPAFGSALNFASCWADAEVVKALIDAKSEINFVSPVNGFTPLMNASLWGNTEAVRMLLAAGADIKIKAKLGQSLLSIAIGGAKLEIVKLLVEAGADPNEKFMLNKLELTVFNSLIGTYDPKGKLEYIKNVSTALSKLDVVFPPRLANAKESDFTPLYDLAKYLLEKGSDPNQKVLGTWGSIIFQATEFGKTGIVLALIEAKADIEAHGQITGGEKGRESLYEITPLMMASLKGNNELVEAFIKAGADINYVGVQSKGTVTQSGHGTGTVTTTTYKTWEYNTALSLASDNGHPDTAEIIQSHGGLGPKEARKIKKK